MEPLPETREALAEFVDLDGPDPEQLLDRLGKAARRIVPDLVGLSLALTKEQVTFTLVASTSRVALLDASQYLNGGPCVEVGEGRADVEEFSASDPLDEGRWRLFAAATAAEGVASTLSLPLHVDAELIGGVNFYASTRDAFEGRVSQLASLVDAAPAEAMRDADLSFSTRLEAAAAPRKLREDTIIDTAIGLVAADKGIDVERARQELHEAAARAGINVAQVAEVVIAVYRRRHHP
jgi:hypothetical protein